MIQEPFGPAALVHMARHPVGRAWEGLGMTPVPLWGRLRRGLAVAGILAVLLAIGVGVYGTFRPVSHLGQQDVDAAIRKALASVTPPPSMASMAYSVIAPSVVGIEVTLPAENESRFAVGTGVVIDTRGTILTSNHVIDGATAIKVIFIDGTETGVTVLAQQPENDMAVLRAHVVPDDLVPATLISSATLNVGDEVVAVGNPYGLSYSVSSGVVSGLGRTFRSEHTDVTLTNMVQFDAAVNPGNSGGPLVNRNGEVAGIVTGLLNPSQDTFSGSGFAVPIESAAALAGPPWE